MDALEQRPPFQDPFRADATGAWAPLEIWKQVPVIHPDKGAILLKSKQFSKTNYLSK